MNKKDVAKILIKNKAITINTIEPYIYTSGIRSPIYCDNRLLLGSVEDRKKIIKAFVELLEDIRFDIAAGVSTAGIPWASWIGMETDKPVSYIRAGRKDHGKRNSIEGADILDKRTVVIEDLITTGKSSIAAVEQVKDAGGYTIALVSIFDYGFEFARTNFENEDFPIRSLCDFPTLLEVFETMKYITLKDVDIVNEWHNNPEGFSDKYMGKRG